MHDLRKPFDRILMQVFLMSLEPFYCLLLGVLVKQFLCDFIVEEPVFESTLLRSHNMIFDELMYRVHVWVFQLCDFLVESIDGMVQCW